MLTAFGLIPFKNAARGIPLVVDLDLVISRRYEANVSPDLAERRVRTALLLWECAVALAEDAATARQTTQHDRVVERLSILA
jgi:hypothetical protein